MKKISMIFVQLLLIVTISSCALLPSISQSPRDFRYEIKNNGNGKTITIKGQRGVGSSIKLIIPETIDGIPVTAIGDSAFSSENNITSVTLPASITVIGDYAFSNNKLTSIIIPNNVKTIGDSAFRGNRLKSVTIPDSVISIGFRAFATNRLESVIIGNGVTIIERNAFADNKKLNSSNVILPTHLASYKQAVLSGDVINPNKEIEIAKKASEDAEMASEMYKLANKKRDEGNISVAIFYYRSAFLLLPTHMEAKNNYKVLWDKRIAENQNLYPAPFAGEWKHIYTPAGIVVEQVYDPFKSARLGGTQYSTKSRTQKEESIKISFNNKNYRLESPNGTIEQGTFFYRTDSLDFGDDMYIDVTEGFTLIELEHGMILGFDGKTMFLGDDTSIPMQKVTQ